MVGKVVSETGRSRGHEGVESADEYQLRKLQAITRGEALRAKAIAEGMELWDLERINLEVAIRRGHVDEEFVGIGEG